METIYSFSLASLTISGIAKGVLHIYLDVKNGHKVEFARSRGYVYLMAYDEEVAPEYEGVKALCNTFQKAFLLFLVAFTVTGCIKLIQKNG